MNPPPIKFNTEKSAEFIQELRQEVNQYFKERNLSKYANWNMKIKTAFMLGLYFIPFALMLSGVFTSPWLILGFWILMGFGMSGIGLSIMHDANHGAYSKNKTVNNILGFILNLIGGYHINWKIQHNVLHHTYTNIDEYDEDIINPVFRFSPLQEHKPHHKYQAFYAPFLYGLMGLYWVFSKDFAQIKRYERKDVLKLENLTYKQALRQVILYKTLYILATIVLPIAIVPVAWWVSLLGFVIMQVISGLVLALIFQPAHVIEETHFDKRDENNSVENNWAIHQMLTTANFARKSPVFSWYVGGLNYQIEHHLFPKICHVHYKKIAPIVKAKAEKFDLPYYDHPTFFSALRSHFGMLNQLGTGKI